MNNTLNSVQLREQHSLIGFAMSIVALDTFGYAILLPLLPFVAAVDHLPFWSIGLVFSSYSLCQLVAAPVIGHLSDRYGRRPLLIWSLLGSSLGFLILVANHSLYALFASRIVDGLSAGNIAIANAIVLDCSPKDKVLHRFSLLGISLGAGLLVGLIVSASLAARGIQIAAAFALAITLINVVIVLFMPESRVRRRNETTKPEDQHFGPMLLQPGILRTWIVTVCAASIQAGFVLLFPLFYVHQFKATITEAIATLTILIALAAVFQLSAVPLFGRILSDKLLTILGFTLAVLGSVIVSTGTRSFVVMAGGFITLCGCVLLIPAIASLWGSIRQQGIGEGILMGLNGSGASSGQIIGPAVTFLAFGIRSGILFGGMLSGLAVIGIVCTLNLGKRF